MTVDNVQFHEGILFRQFFKCHMNVRKRNHKCFKEKKENDKKLQSRMARQWYNVVFTLGFCLTNRLYRSFCKRNAFWSIGVSQGFECTLN